jgi:hypothetical protein
MIISASKPPNTSGKIRRKRFATSLACESSANASVGMIISRGRIPVRIMQSVQGAK